MLFLEGGFLCLHGWFFCFYSLRPLRLNFVSLLFRECWNSSLFVGYYFLLWQLILIKRFSLLLWLSLKQRIFELNVLLLLLLNHLFALDQLHLVQLLRLHWERHLALSQLLLCRLDAIKLFFPKVSILHLLLLQLHLLLDTVQLSLLKAKFFCVRKLP